MPKFSVLTPVNLWNDDRVSKFYKCIESVENQSFKDFEWVVMDDGSSMPFNWDDVLLDPAIPSVALTHLPHNERVIAYNNAFKVAKGEWFVFLDSDDELKPNALERYAKIIQANPDFKMFNFGTVYHHKDGKYTFRDPFTPKRKGKGHEVFGGGNIVNGCFIFHRKVYEALGGYPADDTGWLLHVDCTELNYRAFPDQEKPYIRDLYMGTPYDFSAAAQLEFPEIQKQYMVDHVAEPTKIIKELGNPWGNDYYLFYKYTRRYHSKAIKEYLYIVHPR